MLYEKGYTTGYHKGKEIMFRDIIELEKMCEVARIPKKIIKKM